MSIEANLKFRRSIKRLFVKLRLHILIRPFERGLLNLVYLSKVSRWMVENRKVAYNDFYLNRFDYERRYGLYEYICNTYTLTDRIIYMEFGVMGGTSFKWWLKNNPHPESRFFGFDTFEGLPEDWGVFKKGDMTTKARLPEVNDDRALFVKGLFQDTLDDFISKYPLKGQKVVHMDADLFTSTLFVLTRLALYFEKGDIILFDEYTVPMHEFQAFQHFTSSYYQDWELVGAANNYFFSAFRRK